MNTQLVDILNKLNIEIPLDVQNGNYSFSSNICKLSKILSFISTELNIFYNLEATITEIYEESENMSLFIEISGLLREIGCPYVTLLDGNLETRFASEESIILLLHFLTSELVAAKIIAKDYPNSNLLSKPKNDISSNDTNLTTIMKPALLALGVGKPPENMDVSLFFNKLQSSVKDKISQVPKYFLGKSLITTTKPFTDEFWRGVEEIINSLNFDSRNRRELLLQRLDVTIQSFMWSPKVKKDSKDILTKFNARRTIMGSTVTTVNLEDLLAARDNPIAIICKTSSGESRKASTCKLNKFLIGAVPDRGGRTREMEAPPPEMPAFQKRDSSGHSNQTRGGGGGGHYNQSGGGRGSGGYQSQVGYSAPQGRSQPQGQYNNQYDQHYQPKGDRFSQNVAPNNLYAQAHNYVPEFQTVRQFDFYDDGNRGRGRGRGRGRPY